MSSDSNSELEAQWREGAGNADHIGTMLADLTRKLLRDAIGGKRSHALDAATRLAMIHSLISSSNEVSEHEIIEAAVDRLSVHLPRSHPERPKLDLAKQGTLYVLDRTSADGFASARLDRHWKGIQEAIEEIERERKRRLAQESDVAK